MSTNSDNYLTAFYRRVAARRGAERAIIAVAHQLLVIAYYLLKRLEHLGPVVTLQPAVQSAQSFRRRSSHAPIWGYWYTRKIWVRSKFFLLFKRCGRMVCHR